jgi:signal transduction histidine kinase
MLASHPQRAGVFIEAYGGTLRAESEEGHGSVFSFRIAAVR